MKTFKELTESIKTNIEEVDESLKPGWMLKKDPELAKKIKDKIDIAKKRQASHGNKDAGKSVNEEEQIDEISKDTLVNYLHKASDKVANVEKRKPGIKKAADKLNKKFNEYQKKLNDKRQGPPAPMQTEEVQNHKVNVTVSDPNHQAVSQRKEKIAKRVIVKSHTKEGAVEKAKEFYKKKGYKVHDAEHHSIVPKSTMKTEEVQLEEDLRAQLQKHSDAAIVANKAGDDEKVKYHMNKVNAIKDKMAKQARNEEVNLSEGAYEKAEENKRSAESAKKQGDMFAHHLHMADHHDNMAEWHDSKGRHGEADRHAKKSEEHHAQAMKLKEEVEQIDELNKDTLSSYAKKAETQGNRLGDAYSKARIRKDAKDGQYAPDTKRMAKVDAKAKKRTDGAYAAQQKLNKEESEQMDEGVDPSEIADNPRMYSADTTKKAYYHKRVTASEKEILAKHLDRHYGNTNWRKPVKEESEQIDELNKDTLSSYRMAAHRDVNKKVDQKSKGEISNKDYEHGIKKRSKGITKADNKLGTYKNSRIDTSGNADSIRKFGTNEEVESEK